MNLDVLGTVLTELAVADPATLADGDSIVALHRYLDQLDAITTRATATFDTNREWEADQARGAAGWIMARCHRSRTAAKAELARARALRTLPVCEQTWLAGDISAAHVKTVAGLRHPATEHRLADDEALLVGYATTLPFAAFARTVAYWAQLADPDGQDNHTHDQIDQRRLHLSQSYQGAWFGDITLDPIAGTIVNEQLQKITDEFFKTEWADARNRLGHEPSTADLARTPPQRRADALVEMAIRSAAVPADARRPEPLFTVLVGWETLKGRICELADGTVVTPAALAPWLTSAWLERIVFHSPSRVLDVGVTQRLFTGATRRALEVRDRQCYHPYCDTPAPQCQADHITAYSDGGPTTQENGQMACPHHNRARAGPKPP